MPETKSYYVIKWSRMLSLGLEGCEDVPLCGYIVELCLGSRAYGVLDDPDIELALKFGSWAEAAAVAAFIINYIDSLFDDALEIVRIDCNAPAQQV